MRKAYPLLGAVLFVLATLVFSISGARTAGAQDPEGKTLYDASCKKCHGVRGVPPKAMQTKFPKLVAFDAAFAAKYSKDDIVSTLTKGGKTADMKSFKDKLTPAQMTAVAAYVHELAGAKGQ